MAWKPDYVDLDNPLGGDIQEYLRIDDDVDNTWLTLAVSAASRALDRHCRRQFGRVDEAQARRYRVRWNSAQCAYVADIDDLMSTDDLTVNGETLAAPELLPMNAAEDQQPWTQLVIPDEIQSTLDRPFVTVVERWGWLAIPEVAEQATAIQAGRLVKRRDALFGVAGSPEAGSEMRLLARLDPDVAVLVQVLRRGARPR
jgi:hypothetical protein